VSGGHVRVLGTSCAKAAQVVDALVGELVGTVEGPWTAEGFTCAEVAQGPAEVETRTVFLRCESGRPVISVKIGTP